MSYGKLVGVGVIGKSEAFKQMRQKMIARLIEKGILPVVETEPRFGTRCSASFCLNRENRVTIRLSFKDLMDHAKPVDGEYRGLQVIHNG